jgi:hypothetical protein
MRSRVYVWWKIGIWPFIERVAAAKRSSNKRAKGTIETKPVSVKKENYFLEMIIEKVLPAIRDCFPNSRSRDRSLSIFNTTNAPAHFTVNHPEWIAASQLDGWSIGLKNQCPNSPDTNVCDLGFFRTLQTEQWKLPSAKNFDDLIQQVQEAFAALDQQSLDAKFLTRQSFLDEIIQCHGWWKW